MRKFMQIIQTATSLCSSIGCCAATTLAPNVADLSFSVKTPQKSASKVSLNVIKCICFNIFFGDTINSTASFYAVGTSTIF
jgi:hypothetical protein